MHVGEIWEMCVHTRVQCTFCVCMCWHVMYGRVHMLCNVIVIALYMCMCSVCVHMCCVHVCSVLACGVCDYVFGVYV